MDVRLLPGRNSAWERAPSIPACSAPTRHRLRIDAGRPEQQRSAGPRRRGGCGRPPRRRGAPGADHVSAVRSGGVLGPQEDGARARRCACVCGGRFPGPAGPRRAPGALQGARHACQRPGSAGRAQGRAAPPVALRARQRWSISGPADAGRPQNPCRPPASVQALLPTLVHPLPLPCPLPQPPATAAPRLRRRLRRPPPPPPPPPRRPSPRLRLRSSRRLPSRPMAR